MTVYGPIVAVQDVEDAIVAHLRAWVPAVLREIEDQRGMDAGALMRARHDRAYRGGVDFDSWSQDALPAYVVVVKPGDLEHTERGYGVFFQVGIAVVGVLPTEDRLRSVLSYHGAAVMVAMVQHGGLGGIAASTRMVDPPEVRLYDSDKHLIGRCEAMYRVLVNGVVDDNAGPVGPPEDADEVVADWPTVGEDGATFTLDALPLLPEPDEPEEP